MDSTAELCNLLVLCLFRAHWHSDAALTSGHGELGYRKSAKFSQLNIFSSNLRKFLSCKRNPLYGILFNLNWLLTVQKRDSLALLVEFLIQASLFAAHFWCFHS